MKKRRTINRRRMVNKTKLCLVCSAGGHLAELLHLKRCYSKYPHFFITFERMDTNDLSKHERTFFVTDPARSLSSFLKCVYQSAKIVLKEKPDVVMSTGAGVAIPATYIAKLLLGAKIIFIESFCRILEPSLSGRLVYPISDMFLVQWPGMLEKYGDKARYRGAIV